VRLAIAAITLLASLTGVGASAQGSPHAELALASQDPWVAPDEPFIVRVDVDRVRQPGDLRLDVVVHRAVTSRSQFIQTLAGDLVGRSIRELSVPFDELRFDPAGAATVTVELPDGLRPGVYPVTIAARDGDDDEVDALHTHAVVVPATPVEVPLSVAWVLDYGAPPALQPDGTVTLPDDELDELRVVAAQLGRDVPLTVRPVPETVAALASLDDDGRTTAALADLLRDHQVLWSPFVDLDVAAFAAAGREAEIAAQRVAGAAVLDELDVDRDARTWSLTGTVTEDALDALVSFGVDRVVVDDAALEPIDPDLVGGITLARPFALEASARTLDAVAVDAGLSAHFANDDEVLGAHHLLADLAVLHFDSPGAARGVAVRPPERWTPNEAFLGTAISGLASSPVLEPRTLDGLFDAVEPLTDDDEPVARPLAEDRDVPALGFSTSVLDRARRSIDALRSLAAAGDAGLDDLERRLLVAMSDDLDRDAKERYVRSVTTEVSDAASKVRVLGDRSYRLTAREGTVPLTLVNENDFDVVVDLELSSDKLAFTDTDDESLGTHRISGLLLEAGSTFTQAVPVKARTSGTSSLRIAMRSPDGGIELGRTSITITSTFASWVGIVLSIGAAAFLLLWWASHFRTVRRARKLVPPE
jgi:hypothetical protein